MEAKCIQKLSSGVNPSGNCSRAQILDISTSDFLELLLSLLIPVHRSDGRLECEWLTPDESGTNDDVGRQAEGPTPRTVQLQQITSSNIQN